MKMLASLIAIAAAGLSVPAYANNLAVAPSGASVSTNESNNASFVGPRVGATVGTADILNAKSRNNVTYDAVAGLDAPLGSYVTVGVEADAANFFGPQRDIGFYGRVGVAPTKSVLFYAKGGYSNFRNIPTRGRPFMTNGFGVGGGVEVAVRPHVYVGLEGMHNQYSGGVYKNAVSATAGFRF